MKLIRKLLFPIVPIYYIVTWLRNKLYNFRIKPSTSFDFPVICVGNLSVGGTGKTPMIEYLLNMLKNDYKLATLSRGYKRKTKGFQVANNSSTVDDLGDEPFQFYNKFLNEVIVAVDGNRVNGVKQLKKIDPSPEVILLDDAFQHRKVIAGFTILLTTYNKPYFKDIVLPTGDLREPRKGAKRADIIVVTKCPQNLKEEEKAYFHKKIGPRNNQDLFFSKISYGNKVFSNTNLSKDLNTITNFTLVTGIANANLLVRFLKDRNLNFEHLNFKDHYNFLDKDITLLEKKELILTTEKDFMRLKHYKSLKEKLFYLPIKVTLDNPDKFENLVIKFLESSKN